MSLGSRFAETHRIDHLVWESPLPVETALRNLRGVGLGSVLSSGPLRGRCSVRRVTARRRSRFNNSWRPLLRGELTASGTGSELSALLGPPTSVTVFMMLWLVLSTIGAIIGAVTAVSGGDPLGFLGWLLPVGGIGTSLIGGALASGDRDFIRHTIGRAINGTEISSQGATS